MQHPLTELRISNRWTRLRSTLSLIGQGVSSWLLPPLRSPDEYQDRLAWLALLRWVMIAGQLACVTMAIRLEFVTLALAPLIYSLITVLGLLNIWACRRLQRGLLRNPTVELLAWLLVDWCQLVLLLSLNGGISNPFYPVVFVHAILGGALLPRQLGWAFLTILGSGLYLLNPVVYVFHGSQTFVRLSALVGWLIQFGVLTAAWSIAGALSRRLLQFRVRAEALSVRQQHLQRVHLLGALGAGVAHEFATPLNTMRLRLDRLRRRYEQDDDVQMALRALEQCEQRLRQIAALPAKSDLDRLAPLELKPYLEKLCQSWCRSWQNIHLQMQWVAVDHLAPRLPELVLRQAMKNLLDNAAQATQGQGQITLSVAQDKDRLLLEISDNGPGWPMTVQSHLGEPFVTTREAGTGLGLYTVSMLAEALGGSIELLDNSPQGARVRLCLPLTL